MDESGVLIEPNKIPKVIALKNKKKSLRTVSAERGQLVNVVGCFSFVGIYVPPAVIFPRKRRKEELMDLVPTG